MMRTKWELKADFKVPKMKAPDGQSKKEASAAKGAMNKGLLEASRQVETELKPLLNTAMGASVWDWPRDTVRTNGSVAGTMRDINDTGRLKDSLSLNTKFMQTKVQTKITYSAPHANIVYYGGVIQPYGNVAANPVLVPGRPWVEAVMNGTHGIPKYDILKVYSDRITELWDQGG